VPELLFPLSSRNYPEDLVSGGVRSIDEVTDVGLELGSKASRLFGAAVPLELKEQFAVFRNQAAPPIRNRAVLFGLGIGGHDLVLAYPVIEADVLSLSNADGETHEELVCLQLVDQVKASFERVFGALRD